MIRRPILIAVAAASFTIAMAPAGAQSGPRLDQKKLAAQVAAVVAPAYPELTGATVTCPKKIAVKKGKVVTCTVDANGISVQVTVTQTNKRGAVTIASTQAVIPKAAAEQFVKDNSTVPAQVTVDCGPAPAIVKLPGETHVCNAAFPDGSTKQVTISVVDLAGNVTITQVT